MNVFFITYLPYIFGCFIFFSVFIQEESLSFCIRLWKFKMFATFLSTKGNVSAEKRLPTYSSSRIYGLGAERRDGGHIVGKDLTNATGKIIKDQRLVPN